jgi:hypothetical protein
MTAFPNGERRIALYPERLPKDIFKEASQSLGQSQDETSETQDDIDTVSESLCSEQCESTFNIKSKVDTVPRKPRLSLSRYGRRQILRAGSCFDTSETTERLLLTGTLPGTGNRAHKALAEYSSYASKTLTNWLTRRSPGCKWMYTWEFQKRGALHIHLVVEVPLSVSKYVKAHFKDEWNRILRSICNKSGTNLYAKTATYSHSEKTTQADVTVCDREPSRYISKYISKGSTHAKAFGRFPPKTWYQISRSLLRVLRGRTVVYEVEGLSYSQALQSWEDIKSLVSRYDVAGARRFAGSILSCHGYYYHSDFNPLEINKNMQSSKSLTLPLSTIVRMGITTLENYPSAKAISHATTYAALRKAMDSKTLDETGMLLLADTIQSCLGATWDGMRKKTSAAMWMKSYESWLEKHEKESKITQQWMEEIVTICNNYLTA